MSWFRMTVLAAVVGTACAKGERDVDQGDGSEDPRAMADAEVPGDQPEDAIPSTSSPGAPPAAAGMGPRGDAGPLAGRWKLAHSPEPTATGLELTVDSVSGARFRARLAFLMMGDVGIDPSLYEPQWGEVSADGVARFPIRSGRQPGPGGRIVGRLSGDTVHVTEYEWAGENQLGGDGRWFLVRER